MSYADDLEKVATSLRRDREEITRLQIESARLRERLAEVEADRDDWKDREEEARRSEVRFCKERDAAEAEVARLRERVKMYNLALRAALNGDRVSPVIAAALAVPLSPIGEPVCAKCGLPICDHDGEDGHPIPASSKPPECTCSSSTHCAVHFLDDGDPKIDTARNDASSMPDAEREAMRAIFIRDYGKDCLCDFTPNGEKCFGCTYILDCDEHCTCAAPNSSGGTFCINCKLPIASGRDKGVK